MISEIKYSDRISRICGLFIYIFVILIITFMLTLGFIEELLPNPTIGNIIILIHGILTICLLIFIMIMDTSGPGLEINIDEQGICIKNS